MTKDCDVPLGLFRIKGLVAYSPNILHLLVYRWNNLSTNHNRVVVSNIFYFFYVHPYLGEDSHFDEHIFQRGWNHQPALQPGFSSLIQSDFCWRLHNDPTVPLRMDQKKGDDMYGFEVEGQEWRLGKKRSGGWLVNNLTWPMAKL